MRQACMLQDWIGVYPDDKSGQLNKEPDIA